MTWKPESLEPRPRLTREEQKMQTRERLLDAAFALFSTRGMEATTIDEISRIAGFTRGAFYAHFDGKEAIMKEIISSGFEGDSSAMADFFDAGNPTELAQIYQTYSERFTHDYRGLLWSLEFQMAAIRHPELRRDYNNQVRALVRQVVGFIGSQFAQDDRIDSDRVSVAAEVLVALQTTLSTQRLLDPERVPEGIFKDIFKIIWSGMTAGDRDESK